MHNADLLITLVLDEGRKVRLGPMYGGRRVPAFGRKVRRFASKVPLPDKGGELSIVDKFGATTEKNQKRYGKRPNQRFKGGEYLNVFGTEPKSQKRRDRHHALIHLVHHMNEYEMDNPAGITDDEYNEMRTHADRLFKAEAKSVFKAARRLGRKTGRFAASSKYRDKMSTPTSDVPMYFDPHKGSDKYQSGFTFLPNMPKGATGRIGDWVHDGRDHAYTGALPTKRGEIMTRAFHSTSSNTSQDFDTDLSKEHDIKNIEDLYRYAQNAKDNPIQHDHKTTLEMARAAL